MDDLDLVVKAQDKEFWDKVAEELKPTIKKALEETFANSERNTILQNRLEDYPWEKEESDGNQDKDI